MIKIGHFVKASRKYKKNEEECDSVFISDLKLNDSDYRSYTALSVYMLFLLADIVGTFIYKRAASVFIYFISISYMSLFLD